MSPKKQRYIYVIRCGDQIKIGHSVNPEARVKAVQTARAEKVILEWKRERADATKLEKYLHRLFYQHHLGGEWFDGNSLHVDDIRRASYGFIQYDWD